jgi:hypothetical protein
MGEPARKSDSEQAARKVPPERRAWVLAVVAADLSRNARHAARYIASLAYFPHSFFTVAALGRELGVGPRHARRVLAELSAAGLIERWASWSETTGLQRSNDYVCCIPSRVGQARTDVPLVMDVRPLRGEAREEKKQKEQQSARPPERPPAPACEVVPRAAAASCVAPVPSVAPVAPVAPSSIEPAKPEAPPEARQEAPRSSGRSEPVPHPPQRPAAPSRPVLGARTATIRPSPDAAPSPALAPLTALPGGRGAARVLARAGLTPAQQQQVVDRVLAYHRDKGVQDAARFVHGPIADVREGEVVAAEKRAAVEADWDSGVRAISQRIAEQRAPCFVSPPPKPMPPCDPLETRRAGILADLSLPWHRGPSPKRAALELELREVEAEMSASGLRVPDD